MISLIFRFRRTMETFSPIKQEPLLMGNPNYSMPEKLLTKLKNILSSAGTVLEIDRLLIVFECLNN